MLAIEPRATCWRTETVLDLSAAPWVAAARAGKDDYTRAVLQGIWTDGAHLVATDGRRMHIAPCGVGTPPALISPIVIEAAALATWDGQIRIERDVTTMEGWSLAQGERNEPLRPLEGKYPPYDRLLPDPLQMPTIVPQAGALRDAARAIVAYLPVITRQWKADNAALRATAEGRKEAERSEPTPMAILEVRHGRLSLSSDDSRTPCIRVDGIRMDGTARDLRIGVNPRYLVDALAGVEGQVSMDIREPSQAMVLRHERGIALIMPVRLHGPQEVRS